MPRLVWDGLLWLVVLGFPWLLARRPTGGNLASLVGVVNLLMACSFILLVPSAERLETALATLGLLAIDLAAWYTPERLQRRVLTMVRWPSAKIALTLAMAAVIPLGLTEFAARILSEIFPP
jgi:hypothetical protein